MRKNEISLPLVPFRLEHLLFQILCYILKLNRSMDSFLKLNNYFHDTYCAYVLNSANDVGESLAVLSF